MVSLRHRNMFFTCSILLLFIFTASSLHRNNAFAKPFSTFPPEASAVYQKKYKPQPPPKSYPIEDNFPLAAAAHSAADLPHVPEWNRPPSPHVLEKTPLFIGFTRNWPILQQVVVSYINAGWPPSDIHVIENTGVMDSNKRGLLSLQNPFFLNHTRLNMLGVNILVTPTLLTFAQLQNYYLYTSMENKWDHYFWSHMDVVALSYETKYTPVLPPSSPSDSYTNFTSLYKNCIAELRNTIIPDPQTGKVRRWAMRFFSYDRLALVNVAAFVEVGGWDTLIPFYTTDCDMHARLEMAEFEIKDSDAGHVFDVASSLDDLIVLYRKKGSVEASFHDPGKVEEELRAKEKEEKKKKMGWRAYAGKGLEKTDIQLDGNFAGSEEFAAGEDKRNGNWKDDEIGSDRFLQLKRTLHEMVRSKGAQSGGRNTWQFRQTGGQGDPFYRDSLGFEQGLRMTIDNGKAVFAEKWGHRDCDIRAIGLRPEDAWKMEHDWWELGLP